MNMPSKGTPVTVDGYGRATFAGAVSLDEPDEAAVMLKFEGTWQENDLNAGYGGGIIAVPLEDWNADRIHYEQLPDGAEPDISTEKRDEKLAERFED
jgi:hypothetical protein